MGFGRFDSAVIAFGAFKVWRCGDNFATVTDRTLGLLLRHHVRTDLYQGSYYTGASTSFAWSVDFVSTASRVTGFASEFALVCKVDVGFGKVVR